MGLVGGGSRDGMGEAGNGRGRRDGMEEVGEGGERNVRLTPMDALTL